MIKSRNYQINFGIEYYGNDLCEGSQTRLMENMKDSFGEVIHLLRVYVLALPLFILLMVLCEGNIQDLLTIASLGEFGGV